LLFPEQETGAFTWIGFFQMGVELLNQGGCNG
jgi:hypothetical protein